MPSLIEPRLNPTRMADWRGRFGLLAALLIAVIVLSILRPHFLSPNNLLNVVRQISIKACVFEQSPCTTPITFLMPCL